MTMHRPRILAAFLSLLAACSEPISETSHGDPSAAPITKTSTELHVRAAPPLTNKKRGKEPQRMVIELVAPCAGFVFVNLRDTTLPRHERWQPITIGNRPTTKPTMHGVSSGNSRGETSQASLNFYVLEEDVGQRIRLEIAFEHVTGKQVLDELVTPMFGEEQSAHVRSSIENADAYMTRTASYELSFPGTDTRLRERHNEPQWSRVALRGELGNHKVGWRQECTVRSGEFRGLGFEAFMQSQNAANVVTASFSGQNVSVVRANEDPESPQYGRCAVLEIAWLADS